jgi:hypothetical protein
MAPPIDHVVIIVKSLAEAGARWEKMGFTLTPRAQHPFGTANRLVQFSAGNFIELLEIDRPELIPQRDLDARPPVFSFGQTARDFLARHGEGFGMMVLATTDAAADRARYEAAGLRAYKQLDFERLAGLPDGRQVKVAFSLAITDHAAARDQAFFTCHNKYPENFWKADYQRHTNRAVGLREVVIVADKPQDLASFAGGFSGGSAAASNDGLEIAIGRDKLSSLTPSGFAERFGGATVDVSSGARLAALVIAADSVAPRVTPASEANGVAIAWVPA